MNVVARAVLGFQWLLSWLPLAVQAAVGRGLGRLLWVLAGSRRRIALRNLELTMPDRTEAERRAIAYENFQWIARSFLERGLLWYASPQRLRRLIHVEGDPGFAEPLIRTDRAGRHGVDADAPWTELVRQCPGKFADGGFRDPIVDCASVGQNAEIRRTDVDDRTTVLLDHRSEDCPARSKRRKKVQCHGPVEVLVRYR